MMDNSKIIIVALIVVIIALLIGMIAIMPNLNKQDAQLKYDGNATINKGDSIKIILTDANGSPIVGQTVNITVTDDDGSSDYHSAVTNENGVGTLNLDKGDGEYTITISYGGNDKYKSSTITQKIKIEEAAESSSSSSSSTPSAYAYKSDGTPMYSQAEVDRYMANKYGLVDYHVGDNGYIDMDEPGYDDAGHWVGY